MAMMLRGHLWGIWPRRQLGPVSLRSPAATASSPTIYDALARLGHIKHIGQTSVSAASRAHVLDPHGERSTSPVGEDGHVAPMYLPLGVTELVEPDRPVDAIQPRVGRVHGSAAARFKIAAMIEKLPAATTPTPRSRARRSSSA
jgi:hypothetical protein